MRETKERYDSTATLYNRRYRDLQETKYSIMVDFPVKGRILDIGCGTGLFYDFLRRKNRENRWTYIGVDLSPEMLKRGNAPGKILADCEKLPLKSEGFEYAFSFTVLQNLRSHTMIHEALRILKKGGTFVMTTLRKLYTEEVQTALSSFDVLDTRICGEDMGHILRKPS